MRKRTRASRPSISQLEYEMLRVCACAARAAEGREQRRERESRARAPHGSVSTVFTCASARRSSR